MASQQVENEFGTQEDYDQMSQPTYEDEAKIAEAEEKKRKANLKSFLSSPSMRPKIIAFGLVLFIGVFAGYSAFSRNSANIEVSTVSNVPNKNSGVADDPTNSYNKLSKEVNEEEALLAEKTGGSHIDVPVADDKKPLLPDVDTPVAQEKPKDVVYGNPQQQQQNNAYNQQNQAQDTAIATAMNTQAEALMSSWAYKHHNVGSSDSGDTKNMDSPQQVAANGQKSNQTGLSGGASTTSSDGVPPALIVKAGDIFYGVSNIDVNTDSASPEVTASVLTGPLKGATLIGAYSKGKESVVLRFTSLSAPWLDQQVRVNVVAVDPDTTSKDLATSVDHHYLERYGILIASSFIAGIGEAAERAGNVTTTGVNGTVTVSDPLNTANSAKVALGRAGAAVARDAEKSAQIPTTVRVDPGTAIGLLFLENTGFSKENPVKE